tara:strand:- start:1737 stop:2525 length:789 start_codon:yes stop_codon:yes gene_type:complete
MATQTQEVTQRLAPFQEKFLADIFKQAQALKGTGMPFSPEQVAGLTEQQLGAGQLAMGGVGAYQPYLDAATQFAGPGGAAAFMNPYESAVVDQSLQDIARAGAMQQGQLAGQAAGAGAFGGSRAAVASGELARGTLEQQARTSGQLRASGFQQAQQAAQQAAARFGQLGTAAQQMNVQDINTLLGIGSLYQGQAQAELDAARRNELAQQALPYQEIGFLSDLFRGVPAMQSTFSQQTTPQPSTMQQLAGLGIAGLGAYNYFN